MDHRVAPRPARATDPGPGSPPRRDLYAALDLGTNNCRLLIARPACGGLQVVDSFSRIVRLGEGLSVTGRLGQAAIDRTFAALAVCRDKIEARGVFRSRLIATEACRAAENGPAFIDDVRRRTGLDVEIVDRGTEASLAAEGCAALADAEAEGVVLFDIGGGYLRDRVARPRPLVRRRRPGAGPHPRLDVAAPRRRVAGRPLRRRRRVARRLRRHGAARRG